MLPSIASCYVVQPRMGHVEKLLHVVHRHGPAPFWAHPHRSHIAKHISIPKSSSGIRGSLSQIRATRAIQNGLVWKTTMTMETGASVTPQFRRKKSVWPNRLRITNVHFFSFQGNIFTGLYPAQMHQTTATWNAHIQRIMTNSIGLKPSFATVLKDAYFMTSKT